MHPKPARNPPDQDGEARPIPILEPTRGDHRDGEEHGHHGVGERHVGIAPPPRGWDAGLDYAPDVQDTEHQAHTRRGERDQPAAIEADRDVDLGRAAAHVFPFISR